METLARALIGISLLALGSWPAEAESSVPLEIVGKERVQKKAMTDFVGDVEPFEFPDFYYQLTLRNNSDKVIDAWSFSCLQATSAGNAGIGGSRSDGFRLREHEGSQSVRDKILYPGKVIELKQGVAAVTGPYDAITCRVDAVVFSDLSIAGDPEVAHSFFEQRLKQAAGVADSL